LNHGFETRSFPNSLAATLRGFTFYLAVPISSIRGWYGWNKWRSTPNRPPPRRRPRNRKNTPNRGGGRRRGRGFSHVAASHRFGARSSHCRAISAGTLKLGLCFRITITLSPIPEAIQETQAACPKC